MLVPSFSSEAVVKTLRLAVPLVLAAFSLTCHENPTDALGPAELEPVFASCGDPPCGRGGRDATSFALSFDGNDGTETPDSDALDVTDTWTMEGWIKPSQPQAGTQCIICKWGLSVSASYGIAFENDGRFANGRFDLVTHDPAKNPNNTKIFSSKPFQANVWQHFALVFDQGQVWLYINGVLDASCGGALGNCYNGNVKETVPSVPFLNTPQITTSKVSIGRQSSPEGFISNHYLGELDEFRFWNVARTAKQIRQNMNKALNLRKASGLVAYWRMNEGIGQVAADLSSNGHDLQLGSSAGADAADPAWVSPGKP